MKRILRRAAVTCLLLAFVMLLTGCISIEMKVNKNGSCDLKYEIRTEGMVSLSDVKGQLQASINEANEDAGKNVAKLKSVKEKDGVITAEISVSNVSFIDDGAYFGKYSDFKKEYPDKLGNLREAKSGDPAGEDDIKGAGGLNAVLVSGMESGGGDLTKFTMILPGTVQYVSSNVTMIDNKTVSLDSGYGLVLYKRGGGAGWLLYVLIIVVIAVVALVLLGKKKPNKASEPFAAAPAAAPVYAGTAAAPAPTAAAPAQAPTPAPSSAAPVAGIHCPHCNSVQKSGAVFCSACGGKISQ